MKAFTLQDDTGDLAVFSAGELPAVGSDFAVKGTVKSAAIIGGSSMGLRAEETERLRQEFVGLGHDELPMQYVLELHVLLTGRRKPRLQRQ